MAAVSSVERKNAQVAGLGELHRVFHTFPAADFADADHVGGLAHSVLYRRLPVYGVDADFALGKDAAARFVDKLNRVFDGNDMAGQGFVAVFEHSRRRWQMMPVRLRAMSISIWLCCSLG